MVRRLRMLQEANITDTSTTNITNIQETIISPDVVKFAEDQRYFRPFVREDTSIMLPNKSVSVKIPKTTSHLDITTSHTEGAERTYTEMTHINTVTCTPTFKLGAIAITKELVDTSSINLIELARYTLVQDHEENIEAAIAAEAETGTDNILYGGDASDASGLTTGDTITVDLVADAIAELKDANSFQAKAFFVANEQEKVFHKSSQFTNAAEYGGREVVLNGEIGKYLGMKILSTENTTAYANSATDTSDSTAWGAAGHSCLAVGDFANRKVWMTLAWKQKLKVDYEYLKRYANHYLYYDSAYDVELIQSKAQCLVKVTDA